MFEAITMLAPGAVALALKIKSREASDLTVISFWREPTPTCRLPTLGSPAGPRSPTLTTFIAPFGSVTIT